MNTKYILHNIFKESSFKHHRYENRKKSGNKHQQSTFGFSFFGLTSIAVIPRRQMSMANSFGTTFA